MANQTVDQELGTLRGDLDSLRSEVRKLSEDLSRTAQTGASAISAEAQAEMKRLRSELDDLYERAVSRGQATWEGVEEHVERNPLLSLGIAFGAGLLLGKLLDR